MSNRWDIHHGDVLEVLRGMPSDSFDAILSDVPYGLGSRQPTPQELAEYILGTASVLGPLKKGVKHCANRILRDTTVMDSPNHEPGRSESTVTFRVRLAPRRFPVLAGVQLDDEPAIEEKIQHVGRVVELDDMLVNKADAGLGQGCHHGEFRLWERDSFAGCVEVCGCFSQLSQTSVRVLVRLRHDSLRQPGASASEVTPSAAELRAVLRLELGGHTGELLPAEITDDLDAGLLLVPSQSVGALPGTGGLLAALQVLARGDVLGPADGAHTLDVSLPAALWDRFHSHRVAPSDFMGQEWQIPSIHVWREMLRVLKPGAPVLSFAGSRTSDLIAIGMRAAGFELRDTVIHWVYASGFPKSLDISKAIDTMNGDERAVVGLKSAPQYLSPRSNSPNHMDRARGVDGDGQ